MRRTNALQNYLERLSRIYTDGETTLSVEWTGENPHITPSNVIHINPNIKKWIGKDIDQSQELRVIVDSLNHEVEHYLESDLSRKRDFMEQYKDIAPNIAGAIFNIIEDVYIDSSRTQRWKGMKTARAYTVSLILSNSYRHPKISGMSKTHSVLEGTLQIALSGYAKGFDEISDSEVRQYLGWVRYQLKKARKLDSQDEREELAHQFMERILEIVDVKEAEKYILEEIHIPTGEREEMPTPDSPEDIADNVPFDEDNDRDEREETKTTSKNEDEETNSDSENDVSSNESNEETFDTDNLGDNTPSQEKDEGLDNKSTNQQKERDEDGKRSKKENADFEETEQLSLDEIEDEIAESFADDIVPQDETDKDDSENINTRTKRNTPTETGDVGDAVVDDEMEAMDKLSEYDEPGGWYGVQPSQEYGNVDEHFVKKKKQLSERTARDNSSLAEKKEKRDEKAEKYGGNQKRVLETLQSTGLEREIEEAFRELKTRDRPVPSRSGQDIHIENAIRHFAGDVAEEKLYLRRQRAEVGDRAVSVALDLSSSMNEHNAKVAMLALQRATEIIGDQFTACGYNTFTPDNSSYTVINTPLITAPSETFSLSHLSSVWSSGGTPMASGIKQAKELLDECSKREDVLITITDGKPNVMLDGSGSRGRGSRAVIDECRELINNYERDGIHCIGIGVGNVNENTMRYIFGDNGYVMGELDGLAERLIEVYRAQMKVA